MHLEINDIIGVVDRAAAEDFFSEKDEVNFNQVYEDFEVGAATLSTYISVSRDRDLKNVRQPFVRELAINALALYLGLQKWLQREDIEVVYNFNGRQDYVRAVMRAALSQNIDCYNAERTRLKGNIDFYKNTFPHDHKSRFELVNQNWEESALTEEEKKNVGADFYRRQQAGESVIFPSFTEKMSKGEVPQVIRNGKRNIVIFNSSDDEIAAFGELFKNPYFKNQNEGIKFLAALVGKNFPGYNLIIRMHPNLTGVQQAYVREIRDLHQSFPNVFVIEPESTIDSYALMAAAEKVVSFGSTTGLEANFMRKPVILLGIGFYYQAHFAYKPTSRAEIKSLLAADLKPCPLQDTLKIGFYFQQGGIKTRYYHEERMGEGIYFKDRRIHFYSFSQRLKAKLIQKAYQFFNIRLKL